MTVIPGLAQREPGISRFSGAQLRNHGSVLRSAPNDKAIGFWFKCSAGGHLTADLGAELVDQLQALLGLDMPEGPAVAGLGALRHCADAVDGADLVAEHDRAVGAHQRTMPLLGVDELRAGYDHAALDQLGEG